MVSQKTKKFIAAIIFTENSERSVAFEIFTRTPQSQINNHFKIIIVWKQFLKITSRISLNYFEKEFEPGTKIHYHEC